MKSSKRILLSCVAASVLASGSWAATHTVNDANTTGAILATGESLDITNTGSISRNNRNNHAVIMRGTNNRVVNDGNLSVNVSGGGDGTAYTIYVENGMTNSSIINNGLIKGTTNNQSNKYAHGIYAQVVGTDSNITNNGEIDLTGAYYYAAVGINLETLEGDISNTGEIKGTEGIRLYHLNGNITNSGDINATSTGNAYTKGIKVFTDGSGSIVNTATGIISATSAGNGGGTGIEANNFSGTIDNQGIINGKRDAINLLGTFSGSLNNSGTMNSTVIGIRVGTLDGNITNSGTLNTTTYHAIQVSNNTTGTILNTSTGIINATNIGINLSGLDGTINNQGIINAQKGIESYSLDGNLLNSGDINATDIGISLTDDSSGNITNSSTGEIKGTNYAIKTTDTFSGIIDNTGTIIGGTSAIKMETFNGNITNSGNISAINAIGIEIDNGNGVIENTLNGLINAQTAFQMANFTGSISNAGTINTEYINAGQTDFTNSGTLNLTASNTSLLKTFTQTSTGTLGIDLVIAAGGGSETFSKLETTGAISLADGSTIDVDVTGNGAETLWRDNNGTVSEVLKSTGSTITADLSALNITDNSALLDFTAVLNGSNTALSLTTQQSSSILEATQDVSASPTYKVAQVLDDVTSGANAEVDAFIGVLNGLPTNQAVADAVTSTLPAIIASTPTVSTQVVNGVSNVVQARQTSVRGFNSGDIAFSDKNMWFKPYGSYAKQDNKDGINGFSANTYGFGMGLDGEYSENKRAGFAVFYTMADVDTNSVNQNNDLDVFSFVGYGSNPIMDEKSVLFYQAGFGLQKSKSSRVITGTGTATANYNSKSFFIQAKATREIDIDNKTSFTPALKASYKYFKNPSYSESGVGGMGLDVESFTVSEFEVGIESDFKYAINDTMQLLSNIALNYNFNNDAQTVSSGFQGTPGVIFSTSGIENSALSYELGLGVATKLQDNLILDIKYDFNGKGSDFTNHIVSAKFNYKF